MNIKKDSKKILISKTNNQLRVARVVDGKLYDLEIEPIDLEQKIDNILNGEVVSIEPSLEAAFVNYGAKKNGFLPLKEISPEYYPPHLKNQIGKANIKDVLFEGQKVLIQINKEERGSKGAAVSIYISLAGCYLVLMPNNPKAGGISRRILGEDREALHDIFSSLVIPAGMGVIIRTASIGKTKEELQWDLDNLVHLWRAIKEASDSHGAPCLLHQESDIALRSVRDHFRPDITEIFVDDQEIYDKIHHYLEIIQPQYLNRLKLYMDAQPLFSRFKIERQIESVFSRKVKLPSGGELVIDRTEALIAVDVNSARATKGEDIETTALETNIEAAWEVARQLRIRDLGGLVVIDFIDMEEESNKRKVENILKEAMREDRARVQIGYLSRFGLLEMSRQRLRPTLGTATQVICPRCHGQGSIRSIPFLTSSIIHILQEMTIHDSIKQLYVHVPVSVATYMLNEKRTEIAALEKTKTVNIVIVPNPYMQTPEYRIDKSQKDRSFDSKVSYELATPPNIIYKPDTETVSIEAEQKPTIGPAVKKVFLPKPSIVKKEKKPSRFLTLLKKLFIGDTTIKGSEKHAKKHKPNNHAQLYKTASDQKSSLSKRQPSSKFSGRHPARMKRRKYFSRKKYERRASKQRTETFQKKPHSEKSAKTIEPGKTFIPQTKPNIKKEKPSAASVKETQQGTASPKEVAEKEVADKSAAFILSTKKSVKSSETDKQKELVQIETKDKDFARNNSDK